MTEGAILPSSEGTRGLPVRGSVRSLATLAAPLVLAACGGASSALAPAGVEAEATARLWWWMAAGAVLIWTAVVALGAYALRTDPDRHTEAGATRAIIVGGTVFTTIVVGALLVFGLTLTPDVLRPGPPDGLVVEVSGEEFWWRVRYLTPTGDTVEAANEVRLPLGRRTELRLSSPDVIHSFWIPSLAGKMDMIPGRVTRMALEPTRTGRFEGVCAEFCGMSHAKMRFVAVVSEAGDFDQWLEEEGASGPRALDDVATPAPATRADAAVTSGPDARGRDVFLSAGCAACHTVRGTRARGTLGPDLTHVGSRETLAAGILPNDAAAIAAWIADPERFKPGVHMPPFGMFADADVRAVASWLSSLR